MRIIIVNRSKDVADSFAQEFRVLPIVELRTGGFEELPAFDCIATAGNSFGLMDAGIDLAIVRFFGRGLMEKIQSRILDEYRGEQPVGTSMIVETGMAKHPCVAHTPTMRTPMNIAGTDHVYLATWASLLAASAYNRELEQAGSVKKPIDVLALPGFGTGTGGFTPAEAALQMRLACENFLSPPERIVPDLAQQRQERIHYGGRQGFLQPRQSD